MFNLYPLGTEVVTCSCYHQLNYMKVEGIFTIFDRHYILNSEGPKPIPNIDMSSILKFVFYPDTNAQHYLFRFYVAVRKLDNIIIWLSESKMSRYVVFDGPGLLSDTLQNPGNFKITTTFQTVVLMLKSDRAMIKNNSVVFVSKHLSSSWKIKTNQTENSLFHFPNNNCKENPCVVSVFGDLNYQINITVISVNTKILNDFGCFYAGIVTAEWSNSEYKEIKTVCESKNDLVGQSIYSFNSSLVLVLYWYQEYSEINTSMTITQTNCKPVFIDLCWLHNLCFTRETMCISYLFNVTRFSGVNLTFHVDTLTPVLNPGDCAVLQFLDIPVENGIVYEVINTMCYIELILKHSMDISVRVSYNQTDFSFVQTKLHFCDDMQSCHEGISEPMIQRVTQTSGEVLRSGQKLNGEGLSLSRDNTYQPWKHSWIELAISSNDQSSKLTRFARDFLLNKGYIHLGTMLPVSHAAFSVILLKSNTKVFDSNISLTVDIFTTTYYNKEEICE